MRLRAAASGPPVELGNIDAGWQSAGVACLLTEVSSGHAMPTGTVTMLFTDIEGSTRLLKQLGEQYGELLADHRQLLREAFAAHGGREMDTQGDAFFIAFARARNAVEAAVEAQRALARARVARRRRVPGPHGPPHRRAVGRRRGLPRHGPASGRPHRGCGARRPDLALDRDRRADQGRPARRGQPARPGRPAAEGHRRSGARLPARRRPGLPAEFPPPRTVDLEAPAAAAVAVVVAAVLAGGAVAAVIVGTRGASGPTPPPLPPSPPTRSGSSMPANGRLTGQIPVGASPSAVAAGFGSIWVANVDAHTVSRVDPVKQTVRSRRSRSGTARRDRGRRRLRLGGERPRRNGHEDLADHGQPCRHDPRSGTAPPALRPTGATSGSRTRATAR